MSILVTQDWDIIRGKEEEYVDFISNRFIPASNKLGLRAVGGFYVQVGFGPRIISLRSVETLKELYEAMATEDYRDLVAELKEHVENYQSKVLEPRSNLARMPYEIQKGVWKYNQYYNLLPGKRDEYEEFMKTEYLPTLARLDYVEVTGIWNVLIGGPSELLSELTFKSSVDIGRLLDNPEFRELTYVLRTEYVSTHLSRILRTTERFDEPKWFRL